MLKQIDFAALLLLVVGALNWGLVGLFNMTSWQKSSENDSAESTWCRASSTSWWRLPGFTWRPTRRELVARGIPYLQVERAPALA